MGEKDRPLFCTVYTAASINQVYYLTLCYLLSAVCCLRVSTYALHIRSWTSRVLINPVATGRTLAIDLVIAPDRPLSGLLIGG